jgi:type I restriction enzyme S subunit
MENNWKTTTLGEIALGKDGAVDGPFGSNLPASCYVEVGTPVIRGSNLSKGLGEFKDKGFVFVPDEILNKLSRCKCVAGDIIFTKKGTLGQTGIIRSNHKYSSYILSSNQMRLRVNHTLALPEYVYYWVSSQKAITKLIKDSESTGVPKINLAYLRSFPIDLPSIKEQQRIVGVLKSINSKIELNNQINQTLEHMAKTLFKSWFVDFDPVFDNLLTKANFKLEKLAVDLPDELIKKAKKRLVALDENAKKLLSETLKEDSQGAHLQGQSQLAKKVNVHTFFPSDFEHREQSGWIPMGWEEETIKSIVEVTDFVANGSFAALKENVTLSDVPDFSIYVRTTDFKNNFSEAKAKYASKKSYDFLKKSRLMGDEVIISNVGDVGTVFRPPVWLGMPMTLGSNAITLNSQKLNHYLYLYFSNNFGQHQLDSITSGSAQQKFNKTGFRGLDILVPSASVIERFNVVYTELNKKLQKNKQNTMSLTKIRDILLPTLISGELQIPDVITSIEKTA